MQEILNGSKYSIHYMDDTDREEILKKLGAELCRSGHVKESYIQAVCDREKVFPTGLPMSGCGIAIPHADKEHVNNEAMIVGVLNEPVEFQVMGSESDMVGARLVFMLAIKDPQAQLDMLQKLIAGCQDEGVLNTLCDHSDKNAMQDIMSGFMA